MSSDEDNDNHAVLMAQDRMKKVKRTRQRVDAGEPRNSYASIPSYSPGRPSSNQNGMGAKSLNELLARSLNSCNPLKERNGEDLLSEKLTNGTSLELTPFIPPGMNGNAELISQTLDMTSNGAFRLGMIRTGSPPLESSKLLREILQGKKQGQFMNSSSTPLGSPTGFKTSNGIITQLLKCNISTISNGGEESDESQHHQPGNMHQILSDDSDMESKSSAENPNDSDMNFRDKSNSDSQSISRNENGHGSHMPEDPILIKRARVENIVTNMRMSPNRINSDQQSNSASPEVRKQKRKQYQPQLYDSRCIAHTVPKQRRVEREMLKKQLKQMQDQLAEMQQRYCELFENESSEESEGVTEFVSKNIDNRKGPEMIPSCNDMPKTEDQAQAYGVKSDNVNKDYDLDGKVTNAISEDSSQELDPGHFIDQARKLVSEQEKLAKITDTKLDLPSKLCSQNLDWNSLAQALKTELSTSFSVIIDSILTRFVQNHVDKPILDKEIVKDLSVTSSANIPRKPVRAKVTDKGKSFTNSSTSHPAFSPFPEPKISHRLSPFTLHPSAPTLYNHSSHHPVSLYNHHIEPLPEQTEAMPLIVTPKKKRHKVTDTRISPRTVSRVLSHEPEIVKYPPPLPTAHDGSFPTLLPTTLPTTVAIPNPSLTQSDLFGRFPYEHNQMSYQDSVDIDTSKNSTTPNHYSIGAPGTPLTPADISHMKSESAESSDGNSSDIPGYDSNLATRYLFLNSSYSSTLTPMHLRKAKLMFFFVRYPSSAILKMYFPDIKFNKNNTAQLIKWFSNFREFYYIQMEKYARQAISEGVKNGDELTVTTDSELYRVLNLHYNRNNHIEVPPNFRNVVEQALREFFKALIAGKDQEQSWKKSIYKIIARMDDPLPEYFKTPNFLEQLE